MRSQMIALVVLMSALPASFAHAEPPKPGPAIQPTEVIKLFDGKSLDSFYTFMKDSQYEDPRNIFSVTDGLLHISGDGFGGLVSKKAYRDYHCVLEYRWGSKTWQSRKERTKDSGLLIHSNGPDGGYRGIWMPSLEVQIIEGGVGDFIMVTGNDADGNPMPMSITCEVARDRDGEVIWSPGGTKETFNLKNRRRINWFGRDPDWEDVLGFRGRQDADSPGQQWTRIDTICDDDHVEVFVNGVKVNEAFDVSPASGQLQLQTELAELFVRRCDLYPAGEGPQPAKAE